MTSPVDNSKTYKYELKQAVKISRKEHKNNKRKRVDIAERDSKVAKVDQIAIGKMSNVQRPDIQPSKPISIKKPNVQDEDDLQRALRWSMEEDKFQKELQMVEELSRSSGKEEKLSAVFYIADGELSQHSPKYEQVVGLKTNKDGSEEPVCFAIASCTPLAFSFAATANESNIAERFADEKTTSGILDGFLGNEDQVARGIDELYRMFEDGNTGVTLDAMNLDCVRGLQLYNAMTNKNIEPKRFFNGDGENYFSFNNETEESTNGSSRNWHRKALRDLKSGEGAVIIMGGYSIGVRRIGDAYEIFDSHNSNSYTKKEGACIIHCPNAEVFEQNIEKIRSVGSAASGFGGQAAGIDIFVI